MKYTIWLLPALALLTQLVEPAGHHQMAALQMPFYSLPMLLVLAFMGFTVLWKERT